MRESAITIKGKCTQRSVLRNSATVDRPCNRLAGGADRKLEGCVNIHYGQHSRRLWRTCQIGPDKLIARLSAEASPGSASAGFGTFREFDIGRWACQTCSSDPLGISRSALTLYGRQLEANFAEKLQAPATFELCWQPARIEWWFDSCKGDWIPVCEIALKRHKLETDFWLDKFRDQDGWWPSLRRTWISKVHYRHSLNSAKYGDLLPGIESSLGTMRERGDGQVTTS